MPFLSADAVNEIPWRLGLRHSPTRATPMALKGGILPAPLKPSEYSTGDAGRIKPPHNCTLCDGSIWLESPALTFDVPAQAILLCSN